MQTIKAQPVLVGSPSGSDINWVSIDAAQQRLDVGSLAKGSYIISLGINGKQPLKKMFVKD